MAKTFDHLYCGQYRLIAGFDTGYSLVRVYYSEEIPPGQIPALEALDSLHEGGSDCNPPQTMI